MLSADFTPFPALRTERLQLRQLDISDVDEIFDLKSDQEVIRYLGTRKYESIDEAHNFIHKINHGIDNNQWVYWALSLNNSHKLIGTICLWNISKEESTADIGYELLPEYQGIGLMQEAITAVIEYGYSIGLKAIYAVLNAENERSIRLLVRNGFSFKSSFQEVNQNDGQTVNMSVYFVMQTNHL